MTFIAEAAKAIVAAIVAGLGALGAVLVDGKTFGDVSDSQWVVIATATIIAGYGVYNQANKPPAQPAAKPVVESPAPQ